MDLRALACALPMMLCGAQHGAPALASAGAPLAPASQPATAAQSAPATGPAPSANALFAREGIRIDLERKLVALDCNVDVTRDLIEYLLVGTGGATHESLLVTRAQASVLNTALLLLGVERGRDARWTLRDPAPSADELAAGARPYTLELPHGDGFLLYLAWKRGGELYLLRIEDLLVNLRAERAMDRHRWVYTGSRFVRTAKEAPEAFAADLEQNYISVVFFPEGNVLATAALPDCATQTIWVANPWLVPEAGSPVRLIFARAPLHELPADWLRDLPQHAAELAEPPAIPAGPPVPAGGGAR